MFSVTKLRPQFDDRAEPWGARLIDDLGLRANLHSNRSELSESEKWTDSGLAQLTSMAGEVLPLASMADAALALFEALADQTTGLVGRRLLGMRTLSHALQRTGRVSANGSCHLLSCRDAELAVNLPRDEDWELMPAWTEQEDVPDWDSLAAALSSQESDPMLRRARLLGLAVAPVQAARDCAWFSARQLSAASAKPMRAWRVLDMSHLWAGPLAGLLFRRSGAEVIKLESPSRRDGAAKGPAAFYRAVNGGKSLQLLNLQQDTDRQAFLELLDTVDLVIESSRPRAMQQLGLAPEDLMRPGLSWLSLTGYGRDEPERDWVAFGDDAAVAGGLACEMQRVSGRTAFCGDAIADPLSGLHAAVLAMAALQAGGGYLLSVPLCDVVSCLLVRRRALGC